MGHSALLKEPKQKSRLAAHASTINMILLLLVLILMTAVSVVIISSINRDNARSLVRVYSMEAADKFFSYISRDLTLVQKAAHSKAITAWFADEDDQAKKAAAFDELADYNAILQGNHFYLVIQKSLNEYSLMHEAPSVNIVPHARIDPARPEDAWYFECIGFDSDYSISIDIEKATNMQHLWINHKVMEEKPLSPGKNFLGMFCSGLQIPDVFFEIFDKEKYDEKKVRGYIVNRQGIIQSDSVNPGIYGEGTKNHIREENIDPAFAAALASYESRIDGFFGPNSQPELVRLSKGPYEYAAIEPICSTDWSIIVFYNGNTLSGVAHLLPLLGVMLAALLVYVLGRNALINRLIFVPFNRLIQSVAEGKLTDEDFYGKGRDDEIGDLAQIIRDTTCERQRQEQLLHAVNTTATVLLTPAEEDFETSLLEGMKLIGRCVDVDRINIWRNETIDGVFSYTNQFQWLRSDEGRIGKPAIARRPYSENPEWEKIFLQNKCINGLASERTPQEQAILIPQGVKSLLAIPLYWQNTFYGFFSFDDCHKERSFTDDEVNILRSAGLMIVSALNRNMQAKEIERQDNLLKDALKEAQNANNAKSNFLANMSHEMRTPLNAVIGLSELVLESGGLNEEATVNLEQVYNAGATLLSTVNDILDISKIEAGKLELIPVEYDIPSLLNDAITQSIMRIGEKPIHFNLDINEDLPTRLYGDDLRIKQILNNLLSNAFKYTDEGTVEMSVRCEKGPAGTGNAVWMTIRVSDTGKGIRSKDMKNLFSDYAQVDAASHRKIEGTGLGLPITKRIAEMMDGSVGVESEYGKGSVFTVRIKQQFVTGAVIGAELVQNLKTLRYSQSKRSMNSRLMRIRLPYAKVLVVDDVATNLDVARGMMKPYAMQVDCVSSGIEAINAIKNEKVKYNAVFMDHMMPGMDGIEATKIIREEIGTDYAKTVPIIALTANAVAGNEEMFLKKGFQAFISKPIEINRLDAIIRQWVRDKNLEDPTREPPPIPNPYSPDPRPQTPDPIPHIDGIDIPKGLARFGGDEDSFIQVLNSYAANTRPLLELMNEVTKDNLADYAVTAHGLKGSSRGICAEAAGNLAEALEKAAKSGNYDFVAANNSAFIETAQKLIAAIENALKTTDLPKPKKDKPDSAALAKLLTACTHYDMDEADAIMAEIESSEYESDEGLAVWLRENMDQMNIEEIKEKLSALMNQEPSNSSSLNTPSSILPSG